MHIVLVGAHPDDESIASGTIAKHVDRGHRATIVVATRGGRGHWEMEPETLMELRSEEMRRAAEVLGADLVFMDHPDASVPGGDKLREELVDTVRRLKPDVLLSFHPLVWRDDHRRVGLAASDASLKASLPLHVTGYPAHRPAPEVYFFGRPMTPIEPDVYARRSGSMSASGSGGAHPRRSRRATCTRQPSGTWSGSGSWAGRPTSGTPRPSSRKAADDTPTTFFPQTADLKRFNGEPLRVNG